MSYSAITLELPIDCVKDCSASGPVDDAVDFWLSEPIIASQFNELTLEDSARILYGYGAWDIDDLRDHDKNCARILWIAACDIAEMKTETGPDCGTCLETHLEGFGYEAEIESLTRSERL